MFSILNIFLDNLQLTLRFSRINWKRYCRPWRNFQ